MFFSRRNDMPYRYQTSLAKLNYTSGSYKVLNRFKIQNWFRIIEWCKVSDIFYVFFVDCGWFANQIYIKDISGKSLLFLLFLRFLTSSLTRPWRWKTPLTFWCQWTPQVWSCGMSRHLPNWAFACCIKEAKSRHLPITTMRTPVLVSSSDLRTSTFK